MPKTWAADTFNFECDVSGNSDDGEREVWFLKHRRGAKSESACVFIGRTSLQQHLAGMSQQSLQHFLVQQGIAPPALRHGRKWVVRTHLMLHGNAAGDLHLYSHGDIIVLEHSVPYDETDRVPKRAMHVCSAGSAKTLPAPALLDDAILAECVRNLLAKTFSTVWSLAPRGPYAPTGNGAELCQVFSADFIVDIEGQMWLLEIDDCPAMASGVMAHADIAIYNKLVADVLSLVVLPRAEGIAPVLGSFVNVGIDTSIPKDATCLFGERCLDGEMPCSAGQSAVPQ